MNSQKRLVKRFKIPNIKQFNLYDGNHILDYWYWGKHSYSNWTSNYDWRLRVYDARSGDQGKITDFYVLIG